ncbi:RNA-binding cell elongation regulator Jag/EloR [Chloroflexota bacterium]
MESLEIKAKTVAEATQRALEQLGVSREEVEVTVVKEGKVGILGLGADEAIVRVTPLMAMLKSDVAEVAKDVLERLLTLMGVPGSIMPQAPPSAEEGQETGASVAFDINGDDLGILIGRRGQTLACLQYIVRLIVGNQTKTWAPIGIDVEGYKQRRYRTLQTFARNVAEQVKASGKLFALEPMPAYERRIIHLALADHPDVTTQSIGQGDSRKIVILPKEQ